MARPLLNVKCVVEDSCKYPVALKVPMDDGTVQTYNLYCDQHPNFVEAMDALERMFDCFQTTGYQYDPHPRRRKNRIHRGKL